MLSGLPISRARVDENNDWVITLHIHALYIRRIFTSSYVWSAMECPSEAVSLRPAVSAIRICVDQAFNIGVTCRPSIALEYGS
jgi:hypothetical protein